VRGVVDEQPPFVSSFFVIPLSLFLVGVLFFIALLHHQRDLIILSLLVFGVAGSAKLWARLSLSGIACRCAIDRRRVFPGEALTLTLEAENRRFLPVSLRVTVPVDGLLGPTQQTAVSGESGLLWYQKVGFRWEMTASRRGVHLLGPHHVTTGDLLGFFSTEGAVGETFQVVVYPRIVPLRRLPLPRRDFFGIPGAESPVRDPIYILGTREYQPGRPAKHIHWKASARHHRLQEKVFEPTEQEKILLAVDVDRFARHGAEEEFERTLEAVASLAVRLDGEGCAVGLVANGAGAGESGSVVPIGRNAQHLPSLLELLARLKMEPATALVEVLRNGMQLPWGTTCICFSLERQGGVVPVVEYFRRRHVPVILFVSRPGGAGDKGDSGQADVRLLDEILLVGRAG
jgi:uncharacterized protein (DUF58 family)